MAAIPQRECFRQGWLEAVRTIDQLTTDARYTGDLDALDHGIIDRLYEFGEVDLKKWANDPALPDVPPRMDP